MKRTCEATFFADPERETDEEIRKQLHLVIDNPVIDGLLFSVGGLIAVLNEKRQVLTVNRKVLTFLGIENPDEVIGLRPGEVLECIHAAEMPGGCGTARVCASCGAAISIVTSLVKNAPVEHTCAIRVRRGGRETDLFFRVRCSPLMSAGMRFLLVFLQDITVEQRWAALEQVFLHDLKNTVTALVGRCEIGALDGKGMSEDERKELYQLSLRLAHELRMHQILSGPDGSRYEPLQDLISPDSMLQELEKFISCHPSSLGKRFRIENGIRGFPIRTDGVLCMRVLSNMIINAYEATAAGGEIRLKIRKTNGGIEFLVWNEGYIPDSLRDRIFQRNFTTKESCGRGLGTYSMKLFGEEMLGGTISFTTSETGGTTFSFFLPEVPKGQTKPVPADTVPL